MVKLDIAQRFLKRVSLGIALVLTPVAASALNVTDVDQIFTITDDGTLPVPTLTSEVTNTSLTFTWSGTGFFNDGNLVQVYQQITVSDPFNLIFDSYNPAPGEGGGIGILIFSGHQTTVGGNHPSVLFGKRNPMNTADIGTGLTNLAAGDYTIRFREGGRPNGGSASFAFSSAGLPGGHETAAPVPLPAGLGLLLAGLGGLAMVRRRKAA